MRVEIDHARQEDPRPKVVGRRDSRGSHPGHGRDRADRDDPPAPVDLDETVERSSVEPSPSGDTTRARTVNGGAVGRPAVEVIDR
jgi:hypothetical protein